MPVAPGVAIGPPFVRPPGIWPTPDPDIALRPIDPDLPACIGKKAFGLVKGVDPEFPVPYALAVGFPTAAKEKRKDPQGERLALIGVHAAAEGVGSPDSDQVQFWSEIPDRPLISQLSGMSGGPVFWSDGTAFGLLGFVKEALDVEPAPGIETLHAGPKVNFICQRASYETFAVWAEFVEQENSYAKEPFLMNGSRRVHTSNDPSPHLRNCPPRIAILGWGSLIWEPRELETIGGWQMGGPVLPIEFSRVSNDGRLTLVVDEKNGVDVPTRYILSSRTDMAGAIENLRVREKAPSDRGIGVFDRSDELRNDHAKRSAPPHIPA